MTLGRIWGGVIPVLLKISDGISHAMNQFHIPPMTVHLTRTIGPRRYSLDLRFLKSITHHKSIIHPLGSLIIFLKLSPPGRLGDPLLLMSLPRSLTPAKLLPFPKSRALTAQ